MIKEAKEIYKSKRGDEVENKTKQTVSDWAKESWIKNTDKWNAAKEFAHKRGMKFVILTEKFLD